MHVVLIKDKKLIISLSHNKVKKSYLEFIYSFIERSTKLQ